MKKSTRALVGLVVIDLGVFIAAWYMVAQTRSGAWNSNDPAESIRIVTTTAGAVIGGVSVILLLAFLHHRRKGN